VILVAVCSGKRTTHVRYAAPVEIYVNNRKVYDSEEDKTIE
jgi:hypothetical protein